LSWKGRTYIYTLVATAVRPERPTPCPAESFEDGPIDEHGRRISFGTNLPTGGMCGVWAGMRWYCAVCLMFRVAALRFGKGCPVEFISSGKLLAPAVPNGRCEVALMVVGGCLKLGRT